MMTDIQAPGLQAPPRPIAATSESGAGLIHSMIRTIRRTLRRRSLRRLSLRQLRDAGIDPAAAGHGKAADAQLDWNLEGFR